MSELENILPESPALPIKRAVGRSTNSHARIRLNLRSGGQENPDNIIKAIVLRLKRPKHIAVVSGVTYVSPEAQSVPVPLYRDVYATIPYEVPVEKEKTASGIYPGAV